MSPSRCSLWKMMLFLLLASVIYMIIVAFVFYNDGSQQTSVNIHRLEDGRRVGVFHKHLHQQELLLSKAHGINLLKSSQSNTTSSSSSSVGPSRPMLVAVLVLSKLENVQRRSNMRKTFPTQTKQGPLMKTVFIVGNDSKQIFSGHDDVDVICGKLPDNHQLSESDKIISGIGWIITHYPNASFVFLVRDNMYVNYRLLGTRMKRLNFNDTENMWIGNVQNDLVPRQRVYSDWFVDEFALGGFPKFCALDEGFGLSGGAVKYLHNWSNSPPPPKLLPLGDVFIGYAAKMGSWALIEDHQIIPPSYDSINVCAFRNQSITGGFDSNEMWETVQDESFKDFEEKYSRFCQDPDLSQILHNNVSNVDYFNKSLNILVNPLEVCLDRNGKKLPNLALIMLVHSHPNHFSRRKGIRNTWAQPQPKQGDVQILTLFVIGRATKTGINREVEVEAHHYQDIILTDIVESFKNLTLKLVLGLKWVAENCDNADYYYKGDDDMFVNTGNVLKAIQQQQSAKILGKTQHGANSGQFFMGTLNKGAVIRDPWSKYYVSKEQYSGKFFSPFCSGGSYVISNTLIPKMYDKALTTQLLPADDAYQGMLANLVGVAPLHHPGFKNNGGHFDTCSLQSDVVTVHGFTNEYELQDIWKKFIAICKG